MVRERGENITLQLAKLHYEVSTDLGLLQSNMTWLNKNMDLVITGFLFFLKRWTSMFIAVILKMLNTMIMNALEHEKTYKGKLANKMWTVK